MGQQLIDATVLVGRQTGQHIVEIDVGVMAIEAGRVNQTHDGGGALSGSERTGKQPILLAQVTTQVL